MTLAELEEVRRQRHDQETRKKEAEDEPIMFEAPKDMQILLEPQSSHGENPAGTHGSAVLLAVPSDVEGGDTSVAV